MIECIRKWELSGCLEFSHKKVREINIKESDVVSKLLDSTSLDLSDNHLSQFPAFISKLSNLECINLSFNHITCISEVAFVKLTLVTVLDLSFNHLSSLPHSLCDLTSLKVLLLQHNQICHITESIHRLKYLSHLNISHNIIPYLPDQICAIRSLKTLLLADNILLSLPRGLHLLQVEKLDISNNRIVELPPCIVRMKQLKVLSCHGNPLIHPPVERVQLGLRHIQKYLSDWEISEGTLSFDAGVSLSSTLDDLNNTVSSSDSHTSHDSHSRSFCPCESGSIHSEFSFHKPVVKAVSIDSQRRRRAWKDLKRRSGKSLRRSNDSSRYSNMSNSQNTSFASCSPQSTHLHCNSLSMESVHHATDFQPVNNPLFASSMPVLNFNNNHHTKHRNKDKISLDSIEELPMNDGGEEDSFTTTSLNSIMNQDKQSLERINKDESHSLSQFDSDEIKCNSSPSIDVDTRNSESPPKDHEAMNNQRTNKHEEELVLERMKKTIFFGSEEGNNIQPREDSSARETSTRLHRILLHHIPSDIMQSIDGGLPSSPNELSQYLSDCVLLYRWLEYKRPGLLPTMEVDIPHSSLVSKVNSLTSSFSLHSEDSPTHLIVRKKRLLKKLESFLQTPFTPSNSEETTPQHDIRLRRATNLLQACREINVPEVLLCSPDDLIQQPSIATLLKLCEGIAFATGVPRLSDVAICILCILLLICSFVFVNYLPSPTTL